MGTWITAVTGGEKQNADFLWFWKILAWPVGLFLYLRFRLIRWTSKTVLVGGERSDPCIFVNWHRHLPFLIQHHGARKRWLMVSQSPYMEPIALWCRLSGLKLARGATGQGGVTALNELKTALANSESVMLAVDGPAGPGFKVKRGCIDLAQQTGYPIVPVSYSSERGREVERRWDRMLIPALFDSVQIRYGNPIFIDQVQSLEAASQKVEAVLNDLNSMRLISSPGCAMNAAPRRSKK